MTFWIAINLWEQIKGLKESLGFKFFCYTPIDSYGIYPETIPATMEWDGLATYTEFGAKELRLAGYTKHIDVVGHGTDFTKFFPMNKESMSGRARGASRCVRSVQWQSKSATQAHRLDHQRFH
jgi:hypothetical protein